MESVSQSDRGPNLKPRRIAVGVIPSGGEYQWPRANNVPSVVFPFSYPVKAVEGPTITAAKRILLLGLRILLFPRLENIVMLPSEDMIQYKNSSSLNRGSRSQQRRQIITRRQILVVRDSCCDSNQRGPVSTSKPLVIMAPFYSSLR